MATAVVLSVLAVVASVALAAVPSVPLYNCAQPGQTIPAVGLGTGGYGLQTTQNYPECWIEAVPACAQRSTQATADWLRLGGVRIDSANSYYNQDAIRAGIEQSGVPRDQFFFTSKVGPSNPLGYQDTLDQIQGILQTMNMTYVDLLLIHWPTYAPNTLSPAEPKDDACNTKKPTYNARQCRLNTWKAMVEIWQQGKARAVGVSNYNRTHIQEIIDAGMPLPAVNQCPFNPYRSTSQMDTIEFCKQHNITFNGYSPIGIPDISASKNGTLLYHAYPPPMSPTLLQDPTVLGLATKYGKTPGQILINFQWTFGFITNPRTSDPQHMKDNMNAYDFMLSDADQKALLNLPEDYCSLDDWYECAPDN